MKIGRNSPCPCGSGKKYKKCCYPKNVSHDTESSYITPEADDYGNDLSDLFESINDTEFILQTITKLRLFLLEKKSHIKEYYKIRKLHSDIVNAMVKYQEANKFKSIIDDNNIFNQENLINNKDAFHLVESSFDLETREGMQAFYDLLIYKQTYNINCITEDFIKARRYRIPEKIEFLHSMLNSTIGLFEITKTDMNEGYVYFKDIFTGIEYKLVDIALSGNQIFDNIYIYTRLITYHDIIFNTGLSLSFDKNDSFIKNHILNHKENYAPETELNRFIQLYNYYSQNPDKMQIVTNTIK